MKNDSTEIKVARFGSRYVRFVEIDGEWWAFLKDICNCLNLKPSQVSKRLEQDMIRKVRIVSDNNPGMQTVINECGIYEAAFGSKRPEAKKFARWSLNTLCKLRKIVGLSGYEVMSMFDEGVQESIDEILDTIYYDEEIGKVMRSITIAGGDVDQIEF